MNEIKIHPIFESHTGKWIVASHEEVVIHRDLEMTQKITCKYHEDDNSQVGISTSDYIDSLQVPAKEKERLKAMYRDFTFSKSTRNSYVDTANFEPIEIKDPMTGEPLPDLEEGVDYISELTMWQGVDNPTASTKVSENIYTLIEANILKMRDRNLSIN